MKYYMIGIWLMPKMVSIHELEEKRGPALLQEITIGKSFEQSRGDEDSLSLVPRQILIEDAGRV